MIYFYMKDREVEVDYRIKNNLNSYQELKKQKFKLANDNRLPLEQPLSRKIRELLRK